MIYLSIIAARRAVNVNESITALERALCEMRPEQLENDLKSNFSMDTYQSYIRKDPIGAVCIVSDEASSTLTRSLKTDSPSTAITYPNYLYSNAKLKVGFRLNCSDEESVSTSNTSASNRSMLTNTTGSTNVNSNVRFF